MHNFFSITQSDAIMKKMSSDNFKVANLWHKSFSTNFKSYGSILSNIKLKLNAKINLSDETVPNSNKNVCNLSFNWHNIFQQVVDIFRKTIWKIRWYDFLNNLELIVSTQITVTLQDLRLLWRCKTSDYCDVVRPRTTVTL
jgi:hypothetical protein